MISIKHKIIFTLLLIASVISFTAPSYAQSIIRDSEIEAILSEWFTPIFKANNMNPDQVKIILVNSNEINAFVAGGANIFFYTGLIQKTENPSELIGVMAHELGHISGGHLVRSREALEQASYESILGTLIGIGAAIATGDSGAAAAGSMGGSSMAQRRFLSKSRTFESSADQAGIKSMEKAEMNPTGLLTFLEKLSGEELIPASQQSEYVRTHPLTRNRINTMENAVDKSQYKTAPTPSHWQDQHARIKAKLLGFINPEQVAWTYDERDTSLPARYARTVADYRENRIEQALSGIDTLIKNEPKNPYFYELKGQMLVDFGRVKEALPVYKKAIALSPTDGLIRTAFAHALIETAGNNTAQLTKATEQLQTALVHEPRSTQIHRLLATAFGRMEQDARARLHLAEEALLQHKYPYAKQQVNIALKGLKENTAPWYRAKDILSVLENVKKKN
ncbi:MAG: peptidase M48 family protein [Micavibrio sp.]|nr:peptidase M48 family protein [Micavibrio sp.]